MSDNAESISVDVAASGPHTDNDDARTGEIETALVAGESVAKSEQASEDAESAIAQSETAEAISEIAAETAAVAETNTIELAGLVTVNQEQTAAALTVLGEAVDQLNAKLDTVIENTRPPKRADSPPKRKHWLYR